MTRIYRQWRQQALTYFFLASVCFTAQAQAVIFQAEDYSAAFDITSGNSGGAYRNQDVDIEPTTDQGGGYNVGWIDATEWLAYNNLSIPISGNYIIRLRVASPSGATASVDLNGGSVHLGNFSIPATSGWQNWVTVSRTVYINAGNYSLGVYAPTAGWNFNWIEVVPEDTAGSSGRAKAIPVGIENVNDSPLKAAHYRALLRFVPQETISIDRMYFGFKLRGANCWDAGNAGYGRGDGGLMQARLVHINPTTGLPGAIIASETVNACTRHNQALAEFNGATPVLAWVNTPATLQGGVMYGLILANVHTNPANHFFSVNMPLADTSLAGPHARNELNANANGAIMSLDPREHVAWSEDNGNNWRYGSLNGQYRSYMNNNDTAHPATRIPQYGFRLTNGTRLGAQPYYAYSTDCIGCSVTYANLRYTRTYTELGGFTASNNSVGKLTIRNTSTGAQASCMPTTGYGFRTCTLPTPVQVAQGQSYTITSTGSVEIMKMDWSQRQLFPNVGTNTGEHRTYQADPAPGTNTKDVPNLWAGPLSGYVD